MSQLCPQHLRREWKFYLRFTSLDSTIMTFVQSANTHWMVGLMFDWFVGIYLVDLLHKYNNKFYAWLNPIQSNCRECSKVQFCHIFLKKGPFPASFSFIFVFSIQLTVNVQYFFADDWIRTSDLLNWKRQLCQLRHNHCPSILFFIYWKFDWIVNCFLNWNRTRGFGKYRKTENSQR